MASEKISAPFVSPQILREALAAALKDALKLVPQIVQEEIAKAVKDELMRKVYDVDDFCLAHAQSRSKYFEQKREGCGPEVMDMGSQDRISVEAAAKYRQAREAASNSKAARLARARRVELAKTAGRKSGQSPSHVSKRRHGRPPSKRRTSMEAAE